ncbi:HdeD family acid-resistance protein [Leptolyngbya iicbica]|uniref:HdeD family acid-resistance protein n=2 Tax=Cyanophyceae TaxID=3028117 RepID=A0A4Q7E6Y5_9CYAN|nr:HdeD family acid-resistance protein [Leptolyngbya sp. LK]RZM77874.1 HdeD family acid-resistance protein [Leptolyngbya sp. LK]
MESTSLTELLGPEAKQATGWLIALSIVMILTGILAIALPGISSVTFTLILGWLLLFNGVVRIVNSFRSKPVRGFWLSLIVGILYAISGVIVLFNPIEAVLTLTWLFGFMLIFEGIVTIISAFVNKTGRSLAWLLVLDGVITLILGILVLSQWPQSAIWLIGLYIGISILMSGLSLLVIAMSTRRAINQTSEA